ncbi:MAG: hypothetical protein NTX29_00660 [Actinobacteria bacterium]|nr:hypothetical protein [Actinomycetota bacterium]
MSAPNVAPPSMPRDVRAAEPIHVTRTSLSLAAGGFILWGIGYWILWLQSTGTRLEWVLCTLGPLLLGAAILNHLDHHRRRFGIVALVLLNIVVVMQALVFLPYALNPELVGTLSRFTFNVWGISWLVGALGVAAVLMRKKSRLDHGDKTPETEIHASFFQLSMLAAGMLIYGISFVGLSSDRTSHLFGWLSVIGPALIAIAVIAHIEHLSLRLGRPAVVLVIIGATGWAAKNLVRATTDLMSDPAWAALFVYGVQGFILLLGALACLLVLFHKQAWELPVD